ncbi:hypothetical protein H2198_000293 [Neophaeococcomyces mojaviensis]|uniref:Uncharacterized protein n=1 Tax=Neophaeococcomyces mojaviensis TaxID=3383035 RepID=A0ACC3AL61_9EURO|nr:hypothetical protein H2198_000293 [Knufia sp. JES_112]
MTDAVMTERQDDVTTPRVGAYLDAQERDQDSETRASITTDAFVLSMSNDYLASHETLVTEASRDSRHYSSISHSHFDSYSFYITFDTSFLPSRDSLVKPFVPPLRAVRRWRCEGLFLFAWLLHICIVWTLRALEASEKAATEANG